MNSNPFDQHQSFPRDSGLRDTVGKTSPLHGGDSIDQAANRIAEQLEPASEPLRQESTQPDAWANRFRV